MQQPHPTRLGITPIIESNLEIRFKSRIPESAVPGMIYSVLQEKYPQMVPTNVLEIPESIRAHAPELKYAPLYRLSGKSVSVAIGPNVLSIYYNQAQHENGYPGWTTYIHAEIMDICQKVNSMNIVETTTRLGLRTTDFFEAVNIFEKSELDINFNSSSIISDVTTLERNIQKDGFHSKIVIHSKATHKAASESKTGSIIDIDTSVELDENLLSNPDETIMNCHKANKKIFFDLLKEEFINTLDPKQ